jgi:Icc-related predicted phosphoesterase
MSYGLQYLRVISDLHLDCDASQTIFDNIWKPQGFDTDHLTALIIPGDIWTSRKFLNFDNKSWLAKRAQSFRYIIFVLGNHDYWGGTLNFETKRVKETVKEQGLNNVFLLENDIIDLEDVRFVGATLWTDLNKQDPLTRYSASRIMSNDFNKIKYKMAYQKVDGTIMDDYRRLREEHLLQCHLNSRAFIFDNAKKDAKTRKLIVVTHMAPCHLSIAEDYVNDKIANGYYYSELGDRICNTEIDYWFHGHCHNSVDYLINNTRVINNPRGYYGHEVNPNFNEKLIIPI